MMLPQHEIELESFLTSETSKNMLNRIVMRLENMECKEALKMITPYGLIIMSKSKSYLDSKIKKFKIGLRASTCRDVDCMQYKGVQVFYSWVHYAGCESQHGEYLFLSNHKNKKKDRLKRKAMTKGWTCKSYDLIFG